MNPRIDRLRDSLEEPLLVSAPANVVYLTGFSSSNAALLVEPERVQLFSDFRYAEAAREVDGVEFVETKRDLYAAVAELLSGRIGFEADYPIRRDYASCSQPAHTELAHYITASPDCLDIILAA